VNKADRVSCSQYFFAVALELCSLYEPLYYAVDHKKHAVVIFAKILLNSDRT